MAGAGHVDMALMLDERGDSMFGQWRAVNDPPATLDDAFARPDSQVIVLVGASGVGKSTLLRHYELGTAARGLREEAPLTYYVRLRDYRDDQGGAEKADPEAWLSRRWAAAYPDLPPLEDLLDRGDVVLLLDGLNEIGYGTADEYERQRERWRQYLTTFDETGRNRVAISCRRAEDADAISTATLRVAQVRIGRLDDEAQPDPHPKLDAGRISREWAEQMPGRTRCRERVLPVARPLAPGDRDPVL